MSQDTTGAAVAAAPPLLLTAVTYRRLRTMPGRFEHEAIEATASVSEEDDPAAVLEQLQDWVHERLGLPTKRSEEEARLARERLAELERERAELLERQRESSLYDRRYP